MAGSSSDQISRIEALTIAELNAPPSSVIGVTKGMRILGHKLHELWDRFGLDRPLVNMIIRFLDLPVRVFRQLQVNPRYDPRQPGGLLRQMNEFPTMPYYYREGWRPQPYPDRRRLTRR
jgi:hypothetical protein